MRCCDHDFQTPRTYARHKADHHTEQVQLFARVLGEDPTQPERLNGDANHALEMLAAQSPVLKALPGQKVEEEAMNAEDRQLLKDTKAAIDGLVAAQQTAGLVLSPELKASLDHLESVVSQMAQNSPTPSAHPVGLCQDQGCETCVAQGHQLLTAAQEAARAAYATEIDEALLLAAGELTRTRVIQLINAGTMLRQQRAEVLQITS